MDQKTLPTQVSGSLSGDFYTEQWTRRRRFDDFNRCRRLGTLTPANREPRVLEERFLHGAEHTPPPLCAVLSPPTLISGSLKRDYNFEQNTSCCLATSYPNRWWSHDPWEGIIISSRRHLAALRLLSLPMMISGSLGRDNNFEQKTYCCLATSYPHRRWSQGPWGGNFTMSRKLFRLPETK